MTATLTRETHSAVCDLCDLPPDRCQCDGPFGAYLPTDLGRAQAYEMPRIRQAYRQAARNGESGTCRVLEGIAPDLKGTQEEFDVCDTCGATLDGEPDAFSECDECEERTQQTNRAQRPRLTLLGPTATDADEVRNFFDKRGEL